MLNSLRALGRSGALTISVAAAVAGCGGDKSGMTVYPVIGTVTQSGQPVVGALVGFAPAGTIEGFAGAQVQTEADGNFEVTISATKGRAQQRGLPAGEYRISVIKMESPGGAPSLDHPPKNILPEKYATPESSGLTTTVKAEGDNIVNLTL